MLDPTKKYYTVNEAAAALHADQSSVRKWVRTGRLQRAWDQIGAVVVTGASVRKFRGKQKAGRPKRKLAATEATQ
jgi:hypothetical protein